MTSNDVNDVNDATTAQASACSTTFQLQALGTNDGGSSGDGERSGGNDTDAVFYVKLSDMLSVFKFRMPSVDISLSEAIFDASSDIQYYVFRKNWPTSLKINPSHAMLDQNDSSGMLTDGGGGGGFAANKSLVKHDFIRYISLHLFNTIHGVDFLSNESDMLENITYYGEVARVGIMSVLDTVGTLSPDITMAADVSGNRYLTNVATGNTNISRELLRQISISVPERLNAFDNGNHGGGGADTLHSVPLHENDTLNIKIVMEASPGQHTVTNVAAIPARSYNIKLIMKNTVGSGSSGNGSTNTPIIDSEYFPNGYPYTTNIQDISASNSSAAAAVYADGSPPAPIPLIRYGYQGWYYTNSSAWVNPAPITRNKINWYVLPNTAAAGATVGDLRYFRMNLHLFTNASLPFVTVYTQATGSGDAGGWYKSKRVYVCANGVDDDGNAVSDHTNYSFYMNWNGYSVSPSTVAHSAAALSVSGADGNVVGGFESSEIIFAYSIGTNSSSMPGDVEFILSGVVVGEAAAGGGNGVLEKEYGYIT